MAFLKRAGDRKGSKKVANSVVALSSAAVLAVYTAGFTRTRSAASQLEKLSEQRRPAAIVAAAQAPVEAAIPEATLVAVPKVSAQPAEKVKAAEAPKPEAAVEAPAPIAQAAAAAVPEPAPAPEPVAAPAPPPPPPPAPVAVQPVVKPAAPATPGTPPWKDGTYTGWGRSRHGNIEASVTIEGGRILSAVISQCLTRYSCSIIEHLPPEVAQRQSPDVDFVSGATQSADAFYYAVVEALTKAK